VPSQESIKNSFVTLAVFADDMAANICLFKVPLGNNYFNFCKMCLLKLFLQNGYLCRKLVDFGHDFC
jgi:hypothetical protein